MCSPHVLVVPYPAQGHVIPLLEFSQCLAKHGFRVTFVNTEYNHKRVVDALADKNSIVDEIHLVSIPDGLESWEDRNDLRKLSEATFRVMPGKLKKLIEDVNRLDSDKITCVIADGSMGWIIEVVKNMKIKRAIFWAAAAGQLALSFSIPKLLDDGIIDKDGTPIKKQMIQLAPGMPTINSANLSWATMGDLSTQKLLFDLRIKNDEAAKQADCLICNSTYDLEAAAFTFLPEILPVGPLLGSNRLGNSDGHFWPEDSTCLKWLDNQQTQSVIYVAFGSFTVFDQIQFQELALGLELSNRPFIWVVRPDITNKVTDAYPEGFLDRVANRGKIVSWSPQQKVLSHPSIACFLSHCGWNSTMEGIGNGVPFLCWPYFADQFFNESYICDVWRVGLRFNKSKSGIIARKEIKDKVDQLLCDENLKARAMELKETAMNCAREGGHSHRNFMNFLKWMKT